MTSMLKNKHRKKTTYYFLIWDKLEHKPVLCPVDKDFDTERYEELKKL